LRRTPTINGGRWEETRLPLDLRELAEGVHAETLAAVTLGAVVATVSGVVANMWESRVREVKRERAAALLVGEAISTMYAILQGSLRSMSVGERFGPVTRRMLLSARRELDIYERNRELLLDLRDAKLRVDLHSLMVRISMPLDGIIAAMDDVDQAHPDARERGVEFMAETLTKFPALIERLARVAGRDFDTYEEIFFPPVDPDVSFAPPQPTTASES
ncbi:MAG: hypothetical protein ACREEB_02855, partial [Caulobacteraceae bacterium]